MTTASGPRVRAARRVTRRAALALAIVATAIAFPLAPPVAADGPTVRVEPAGPYPIDGSTTITVSGAGFDPGANGGVGVYIVFGQQVAAPAYHQDALLYDAARWVHPGAGDSPGQAELRDDGTFETTLTIEARYVDGHDAAVDCLIVPCAVITMAAHGSPDRSFDTVSPVSFSAAAAPVAAPGATGVDAGLGIGIVSAVVGALVLGVVIVRRRRRMPPAVESGPRPST